jgi:hypothetical protein
MLSLSKARQSGLFKACREKASGSDDEMVAWIAERAGWREMDGIGI